jgi:hypothetical protein
MKTLVRVFIFACAAVLITAQVLVSAQQLDLTQPGAQYGYTATDFDEPGTGSNSVFRIRLTDGVTVQLGTTGVNQELEGFFSIDNFAVSGRSSLFGVAETPDTTSTGEASNLVNLTPAVTGGSGSHIGFTGINFGTEAGAAFHIGHGTAYSVATDDQPGTVGGVTFPATGLFSIDPIGGGASGPLSIDSGIAIDSLAFGGDGRLYGVDARVTQSLYVYNFDVFRFEPVGGLGSATTWSEDCGLANYRGVNDGETNLYLLTEGDGPSRVGRIWTVNHLTGEATFRAEVRFADGSEVREDLEGFEIPYLPPAGL